VIYLQSCGNCSDQIVQDREGRTIGLSFCCCASSVQSAADWLETRAFDALRLFLFRLIRKWLRVGLRSVINCWNWTLVQNVYVFSWFFLAMGSNIQMTLGPYSQKFATGGRLRLATFLVITVVISISIMWYNEKVWKVTTKTYSSLHNEDSKNFTTSFLGRVYPNTPPLYQRACMQWLTVLW